jgi:hypothetical protein
MAYTEDALIRSVKLNAYDDAKVATIQKRAGALTKPIQGRALLSNFAYDDERTKGLTALMRSGKFLWDPSDIVAILKLYAYDDERNAALRALGPKVSTLPLDIKDNILALYAYDDERGQADDILGPSSVEESKHKSTLDESDASTKEASTDVDPDFVQALTESMKEYAKQALRNSMDNARQRLGDYAKQKRAPSPDPPVAETPRASKSLMAEGEYKDAVIQSLQSQVESLSKGGGLAPGQRRTDKTGIVVPVDIKVDKAKDGELECDTCADNQVNASYPCGHAKWCMKCAVDHVDKYAKHTCPFCNAAIVEVKYIFM